MVLTSHRRLGGIGPVPELVRTGIGEGPYTMECMNISEVMVPMYLRETTTGRERRFGIMDMIRGVLVVLASFF
jgi:adenylosuccinate synthase